MVPVKSAGRKSRLSEVLDKGQREDFATLLLSDVLRAVGSAGLTSSCYVVSPDKKMLDVAARRGARTVPEDSDRGVNVAVSLALAVVKAPRVLVIPADLALLRPGELLHLLAVGRDVDMAISPSLAFDGTNALLFSRSARFPLRYDDDSFWNHLTGAAQGGYSTFICTAQGVMFDVDSPKDFRALARSGSGRPSAKFARSVVP